MNIELCFNLALQVFLPLQASALSVSLPVGNKNSNEPFLLPSCAFHLQTMSSNIAEDRFTKENSYHYLSQC